MIKKKLILIELNEINFDIVKLYLNKGVNLPGFNRLISNGLLTTESELDYENLEPWIQWPSVHTGKTFEEHRVFRLGDFVNSSEEQFFEKVERAGFSVGAISPMNASNNLKDPAYFIPDPWTKTPSDSSFFSKHITEAISQAVNDNSRSKLTIKTLFYLALGFIIFVNPSRYIPMIKYATKTRGRSWRKALFLDLFLYEIHKTMFNKKKPDFSTLFLNAGAHIQHHYFFNSPLVNRNELKNPSWYVNSNDDPFLEMLKIYDDMLLDLLDQEKTELIIATGLSQKPFEYLKFYYRLKDHASFLEKLDLDFISVLPRMTRDFLISFKTEEQAIYAEEKLSKILVDNKVKLFGEIDNRGKDIFVVLTYPSEITDKTKVNLLGNELFLDDLVSFVAIKNGEHQSKGFVYFSNQISKYSPSNGSHVSNIHDSVLQFFGI